MARYFKYKSPDDVVADAKSLGLDVAMSGDFSVLFQPIQIGNLRVGNRLAIHPMEGCDGTLDGRPDELTYRRYVRFGSGGSKLIWGEATAVCDEGRANTRQLWIAEHTLSDLERMLRQCREAHIATFGAGCDRDLVIGLQLTHSGRYSVRRPLIAMHDPLLDPLIKDKATGSAIDDSYPTLTDDNLKRLEDQFVVAAKLAAKIGCDFIDLKQCHRYLLSELLAAKIRPGAYGGSLENRTRLVRNIVGRIRSEVPGLLIATRMNAYDGIPYRVSPPSEGGAGGVTNQLLPPEEGSGVRERVTSVNSDRDRVGHPVPHTLPIRTAFGVSAHDHLIDDLTEPLQVARWLRDWGVELINISMGNPYANPHVVRPAEFPPVDGYHAPEHPLIGVARHFRIARAIQAAVPDVPVIGGGYSWLQDFAAHAAAANVAAGHVAIVGFGRATLSHPDFAKALHDEGRFDRKQICRTFSYCTGLMRAKHHPTGQFPTGCPPFDKDVYGPIWKEVEATRPS
jgi:2,4-dienoyl-CoA reductase-like NADH-dependent reductase (Old Yellow Enzyme family)